MTIRDICKCAFFVTFSNLHQVFFVTNQFVTPTFLDILEKNMFSLDVTSRDKKTRLAKTLHFLVTIRYIFLSSLGMTLEGILPLHAVRLSFLRLLVLLVVCALALIELVLRRMSIFRRIFPLVLRFGHVRRFGRVVRVVLTGASIRGPLRSVGDAQAEVGAVLGLLLLLLQDQSSGCSGRLAPRYRPDVTGEGEGEDGSKLGWSAISEAINSLPQQKGRWVY